MATARAAKNSNAAVEMKAIRNTPKVRLLTSSDAAATLAVSLASAWNARMTGRALTRSTKWPESLASASN